MTLDQIGRFIVDPQWVASIGTLALVVVGILAFVAQKRAADAARDLYEMQRRAAEPNLQRWDRFDDHGAPNADIINAPVTVYLRNYGGRPAKIQAANFFIGDEKEDVELRCAPIVMPGALVMFRLDWHMALTLREERWRDLKLSESEREILGLQVRFSETDDTGQVERTIMMPTSEYRTHFAANAATMTLVKPETPIRTLYPPHNFPTPPMNTGGIVNTSS